MKQIRLTDYLYEVAREKIRKEKRKANPTPKDVENLIGELISK